MEEARECVRREFPDTVPPETDIVIDTQGNPSNSPTWGYYATAWRRRLVYWPQKVPAYHLTQYIRNPYDKSHLSTLFPSRNLTDSLIRYQSWPQNRSFGTLMVVSDFLLREMSPSNILETRFPGVSLHSLLYIGYM